MSVQAVLLPVFVLVALTFALQVWMAFARVGELQAGRVKVRDIALGERNWPTRVLQIANAFHNQLELPLLFYVLTILALFTRQADFLFVVLAWLFVLSRLVHAFIHVTNNRLRLRFYAYAFGALVLMLMWAIFAIRILTAPVP